MVFHRRSNRRFVLDQFFGYRILERLIDIGTGGIAPALVDPWRFASLGVGGVPALGRGGGGIIGGFKPRHHAAAAPPAIRWIVCLPPWMIGGQAQARIAPLFVQRAGAQDSVVMVIFPEWQAGLNRLQLLPATGGIAAADIGLEDDLGAPVLARLGAFACPTVPAVVGDDLFKVGFKILPAAAVGHIFIDGVMQVLDQVGLGRTGNDKAAIMSGFLDGVPAIRRQI
ncbi:MAG: hypothetical protein QM523_00465 [Candidatus Pacebacteria bacterium]|nr:hypothetical protein [Candidatus Paceibacterota bacterium]